MNATAGAFCEVIGALDPQTNGGRFESAGVWLELGLALGGVPGTVLVRCRLKFDTTNTPITIAAISAAARPAIQNGPGRAGPRSLSADRTRADSAGLGGPDMASKARFRSRRKLSRLISEHLLGREVRSQPPGGAIDSRLGGGGGDSHRSRHLVERQIEVEMQHQRQPLF